MSTRDRCRPVADTSLPILGMIGPIMTTVSMAGAAVGIAQTAHTHYTHIQQGRAVLEKLNSVYQFVTNPFGTPAPAAPVASTVNTEEAGGVAAWAMSSLALWKGAEIASRMFASRHGQREQQRLKTQSSQRLGAALVSSPPKQAWKAEYFDQMGKAAPDWLTDLSMDSKVFLGGTLCALATYLQNKGSDTMRAKAAAMNEDFAHPIEAGLIEENAGFTERFIFNHLNIRRYCYGLYTQNKYYTDTSAQTAYYDWNITHYHPVRIIANIMIGMFQHGPFGAVQQDPVDVFLRWAELTGYWEILARLIGVYGWAPVYITTHWMLQTMFPHDDAGDIKKTARTRYNNNNRR